MAINPKSSDCTLLKYPDIVKTQWAHTILIKYK